MTKRDMMRSSRAVVVLIVAALLASWVTLAPAQAGAQTGPAGKTARLSIEVTAGPENKPVAEASVYLKYVAVSKRGKQEKIELNLKTNQEGVTHSPEIPRGQVLIQVVAPAGNPSANITTRNRMSRRFKFISSARRRSGIKRSHDLLARRSDSHPASPAHASPRKMVRMRGPRA